MGVQNPQCVCAGPSPSPPTSCTCPPESGHSDWKCNPADTNEWKCGDKVQNPQCVCAGPSPLQQVAGALQQVAVAVLGLCWPPAIGTCPPASGHTEWRCDPADTNEWKCGNKVQNPQCVCTDLP